MFCYKCGAKMTNDAVYCSVCGARLSVPSETHTPDTQAGYDPIAEQLKNEFQAIISKKVISDYCDGHSLDSSSLYSDAEMYHFTKEQVDSVAEETSKKLQQFTEYLDKQYLNGNILMLDVTEETTNAAFRYAHAIGLLKEDADAIYNRYLRANLVNEKSKELKRTLFLFSGTGKLQLSKEGSQINGFEQNEFKHLCEVIEELEKVDVDLHNKSGQPTFSEADHSTFILCAKRLGFLSKNDITYAWSGLELKNGYLQQAIDLNQKKKAEEEPYRFSSAVPSYKGENLLGYELNYPGSYFIEQFTRDYFEKKLTQIGACIFLDCRTNAANPRIGEIIPALVLNYALNDDMIYDFADLAGLDHSEATEMENLFSSAIHVFCEHLSVLTALFDDIEKQLDAKVLEGELNKAMRSKWMVAGFGVKGAVTAAATQTALNAGTGIAYEFVNSFKKHSAEKKAEKAKEDLLDGCIQIIKDFFTGMKDALPSEYLRIMREHYPYCVWIPNETKLNQWEDQYFKGTSSKIVQKIVVNLLQEDPHTVEYYAYAFYEILFEEPQRRKSDCAVLLKIGNWFGLDRSLICEAASQLAVDFLSDDYESNDITACDLLLDAERLLKMDLSDYKDEQEKIYGRYVQTKTAQLSSYEPQQINALAEEIKTFEQRYHYQANGVIALLTKNVLLHQGFDFDSTDVSVLLKNYTTLNKAKRVYILDFQAYVQHLDQQLEEARHVEEIIDYNVTTKEFTTAPLTLTLPTDIPDYLAEKAKIELACKQLKLDVAQETWNSSIQQIHALVKRCGYCGNLVSNLNHQFFSAEKASRTVKGVVYGTKSEADAAQAEIDMIEKIYQVNHQNDILGFRSLMRQRNNLVTESGKKEYSERERFLINRYYSAQDTIKSHDTEKSAILLIVWTMLPVVMSLVGLLLFFKIRLLLKVIDIAVVLWAWGMFLAKKEDFTSAVSKTKRAKDFIQQFSNIFIIRNSHIIAKDKREDS